MDHGLVKRLRGDVGDRLAEQRRLDAAAGMPPMTGEDERQFARALISQVLEEHARSEILVGRPPLNAQEEEDLAEAIHAALFGVGRLQPLLEDQNIENIDINGYDRVFIGYADGREVLGEPVADSDGELVELIQALAAYSGLSSRPFDAAHPQLDLRLPDGSRLSAVMDVTLRPAISIRRARLGKVFLADLVGEGLGDEIVTMLNAMTQGNDGSLSTIHANSSMEVFNRIATYAIQAAERLPLEATHMLISGAIDFVIFIEKRNDYARGGTLRR